MNRIAKVWKPCEECGTFFWGAFNETACKPCDGKLVGSFFPSNFQSIIRLAVILMAFLIPTTAQAFDGQASYYTTQSCQREGTSGVFTATGERFNESALTCALRRRDFGGQYLVYGHRTGKSVVVRHNDYGPGKGPTAKGVVIDLTPTAFRTVCGNLSLGKCEVSVQELQ